MYSISASYYEFSSSVSCWDLLYQGLVWVGRWLLLGLSPCSNCICSPRIFVLVKIFICDNFFLHFSPETAHLNGDSTPPKSVCFNMNRV